MLSRRDGTDTRTEVMAINQSIDNAITSLILNWCGSGSTSIHVLKIEILLTWIRIRIQSIRIHITAYTPSCYSKLLFESSIPSCYSMLPFLAAIPSCYLNLLLLATIPCCYSMVLFQADIRSCYYICLGESGSMMDHYYDKLLLYMFRWECKHDGPLLRQAAILYV